MDYNPLINGVYWGYNPLDPNWDIQVVSFLGKASGATVDVSGRVLAAANHSRNQPDRVPPECEAQIQLKKGPWLFRVYGG